MVETCELYLRTITQIIRDEAGISNQAMGSALIAIFGVLSTAGSAARQAVQAAMRVIEAVAALNQVVNRSCFLHSMSAW